MLLIRALIVLILISFIENKILQSNCNYEEISSNCSKQLNLYYEALKLKKTWALEMFDAHTKFPSGILAGNYYDLGNFDECLNIESKPIQGKYCLGTIPLNKTRSFIQVTKGGQLRMIGNNPHYIGYHYAICIPHECTAEDASKIYLLSKFDEKYCYSKSTMPQVSEGEIAAITILSIFLIVVILSTSYDVYLYYKNYKPGNEFTIAFSYFTNGRKLLSSSTNPDQLLCLNGIKALSMMWIVMGHEYVNGSSGAVTNYKKLEEFNQHLANMFVIGATVAVDTFFVIGGLVVVYSFLKASEKRVKFNIITFYIHRYIRLTSALAIVVLIHATLLKQFGNGPLWNAFDDHLVEPCKKYFYAALLYIQNYIHDEQVCVPQTWYLSIDMQLFILSPLVLLPLKHKPKITLIGLILLSISGIIIPFYVAFDQELNAFLIGDKENVQRYIFSYYEQTYGRFGAYVIGMILGYLIYKVKTQRTKIKLKLHWTLLLWLICLSGGLACVYAGHNTMLSEYNKWSHSLYIAFNRPAWSLAISGIILLCVLGFGGPINSFLSASIFQFLDKISYSIYLVHYELILLRTYSYKHGIEIEEFYVFFNFWGDFVFSVALAVLLCLTFESPMIAIEKLIFDRRSMENKARGNIRV